MTRKALLVRSSAASYAALRMPYGSWVRSASSTASMPNSTRLSARTTAESGTSGRSVTLARVGSRVARMVAGAASACQLRFEHVFGIVCLLKVRRTVELSTDSKW